MKSQSPAACFIEALAPLGMPDQSFASPRRVLPATRGLGVKEAKQVKEVAQSIGRSVVITAAVSLIHLALLRYVFP